MGFSYNTGVPAANNNPSQDQPDMLTNTQSIASIIAIDHVGFGLADGGKHIHSTYTQLSSKPTISGTDTSVYAKLTGSLSQLYFEDQNGVEHQLTGPASIAANGYTTTINGLIIQWGTASTPNGNTAISFPLVFPNNAFSVVITPQLTTSNVNDTDVYIRSAITTSGFTVRNPTGVTWTLNWMAIGN